MHDPWREDFPYLDQMFGAYLHQDFDMDGTAEEVIRMFASVTPMVDVVATVADIRRFLHIHENDVEAAFLQKFPNSISPSGFDMTAAQWLVWADALIVGATPGFPSRETRSS